MRKRLPKLRPVDLLPLVFLTTVGVLSLFAKGTLRFDTEKLIEWAIFTLNVVLIVAVPTFVRFERSFWRPTYENLPGHALLITLAVVALFTYRLKALFDPLAVLIIVFVCIQIYAVGRNKRQFTARRFLYRWSPLIISAYIYVNLRWFVSSLNPRILDGWLAELDLEIFGAHLSVVAEKFQTPWLTEWLSFHYSAYILYPLVLGTLLYYHERHRAFEDFILAFCLSMYLGFIGYLLVPAVGPIVELFNLYSTPTVPGMGMDEFRQIVDAKYRYTRDTFPSLHTANSLLCVLMMRKAYPRLFWVFVFGEINLLAATIYLRMHYTIDLFAGGALAVFAVWAAPRINRAAGVPNETHDSDVPDRVEEAGGGADGKPMEGKGGP